MAVLIVVSAAVSAYRLPSSSLEPNLQAGACILVLRPGFDAKVGDVVVHRAPAAFS